MRPIYFLIPFWGPRYRDYFLNRCLASLLAPNNFPCLRADDGHRLLIATTKADWSAIEHLPIVEKLRRHVAPVHLEIDVSQPTEPGSVAAVLQQNACQKLLVETAYRDRVYACMLWPDVIFSDGTVAALLRHAHDGRYLVMCPALRQVEEGVVAELEHRGLLTKGEPPAVSARPLVVPPRLAANLSVRHLHQEVKAYDDRNRRWPLNPRNPFFPPHVYWFMPQGPGLILHTFFYQALLMDYAAIDDHDTQCLDYGLFEDVYVKRNFHDRNRIHIVQDSDEFSLISLTPAGIAQGPTTIERSRRWQSELVRQWTIRISMGIHGRDPSNSIRRDVFRLPARWHSDDLDEGWLRAERRNLKAIDRAVGDYYKDGQPCPIDHVPAISPDPRRWPADLFLYYFTASDDSYLKRSVRMLTRAARALLGRRTA